jgi:hypothetical protein
MLTPDEADQAIERLTAPARQSLREEAHRVAAALPAGATDPAFTTIWPVASWTAMCGPLFAALDAYAGAMPREQREAIDELLVGVLATQTAIAFELGRAIGRRCGAEEMAKLAATQTPRRRKRH